MEQVLRLQVVGHVDVDPAVAVQITHEDAEARPGSDAGNARGCTDVSECPVAIIPKELMRHIGENDRRAMRPDPSTRVGAVRIMVEIGLHIIADV